MVAKELEVIEPCKEILTANPFRVALADQLPLRARAAAKLKER